ncbi:hypothetical protein HIM_07863 [Hirsutella minnesotensis 3608]|uniref:Sterigmatocystin biosynthesis monooxygenase stcW n=1 Tax=Hirsutella minnesotensis 3608 TaxID=1043627 RepID=A0A0F7ZTA8_9HYPO|nr:hypothetical protein HIM_07863 [Hirsutella minnesotensis 3608]
MSAFVKPPAAVTSTRPSSFYHEYQPNFEEEDAETQRYLAGKTFIKEPRKLRIIAIGAGASCIAFAREVKEGRLSNIDLVIYEKNAGIGGTWWENRYAGCACDVPSHSYQYTWAPNPGWTKYYSQAGEIRKYFEAVAREYDLNQYIRLDHEVIHAQWDSIKSQWILKIRKKGSGDILIDSCDIFVNGGGAFNNWKWPSIPGLPSTSIETMHSAAWNEGYDFTGKYVVVIGNGSSGMQVVAALGKVVSKLTVVMRSPTWITAGFAPSLAGAEGANFKFSEEQKRAWANDPEAYLNYRKQIEGELNARHAFLMRGSRQQKAARKFSYEQMSRALNRKPDLINKLIPSYDVGCRRPTPGNGYLETLVESHVDVSWGTPQRFTDKTMVLADGTEIEPDVVVCATGFDLSYKPRFPIIGRLGKLLGDQWTPDAKAYMSLAVPNFPNYLHYLGPATLLAHGSVIPPIEMLTEYFVKLINKVQRESYRTFEPLEECVNELYEHHQEYLSHTVWSSHCPSTFKNGNVEGRINLLHGGSRLHYFEMLREPRWEDFRWEALERGKRYEYFGNGRSSMEAIGADNTWYLKHPKARLMRL